jgi:5-methylcytosine-specific restriction endonuclease McrA
MEDWKRFYKTANWQACRAYVWKRDGGLCVDCKKKGMITPAEEVHHVIPLTAENVKDPNVSLNPENLVSLCRECHKNRHGTIGRRYTIGEDGRVIALLDR